MNNSEMDRFPILRECCDVIHLQAVVTGGKWLYKSTNMRQCLTYTMALHRWSCENWLIIESLQNTRNWLSSVEIKSGLAGTLWHYWCGLLELCGMFRSYKYNKEGGCKFHQWNSCRDGHRRALDKQGKLVGCRLGGSQLGEGVIIV